MSCQTSLVSRRDLGKLQPHLEVPKLPHTIAKLREVSKWSSACEGRQYLSSCFFLSLVFVP